MSYAHARVIRNPASFKVGAVEYKDQVSKVRLVPNTDVQTMSTWGDGVDQDRGPTTYTLEISGHSYRGTGGLVKVIDDATAAGTNLTATIQPRMGTGEDICTVTFMPLPTEFGGEANAWLTFETEFPVVGVPAYDSQD